MIKATLRKAASLHSACPEVNRIIAVPAGEYVLRRIDNPYGFSRPWLVTDYEGEVVGMGEAAFEHTMGVYGGKLEYTGDDRKFDAKFFDADDIVRKIPPGRAIDVQTLMLEAGEFDALEGDALYERLKARKDVKVIQVDGAGDHIRYFVWKPR